MTELYLFLAKLFATDFFVGFLRQLFAALGVHS